MGTNRGNGRELDKASVDTSRAWCRAGVWPLGVLRIGPPRFWVGLEFIPGIPATSKGLSRATRRERCDATLFTRVFHGGSIHPCGRTFFAALLVPGGRGCLVVVQRWGAVCGGGQGTAVITQIPPGPHQKRKRKKQETAGHTGGSPALPRARREW